MGEEWQRVTQKRKDGVEVKSESLPPRPKWPKVSRRAAQCVTPHLVNYITSYFWGVGAPALVARARFLLSFVPQRVRREQMDAFSFPTMSCWSAFISPTRPCWHFVLSLNFPCRNAACVCVRVQQGNDWHLCVWEEKYVGCHLPLSPPPLRCDDTSDFSNPRALRRAPANVHTHWLQNTHSYHAHELSLSLPDRDTITHPRVPFFFLSLSV